VLTRPIAAAAVFDALPAACERDAALCDEVKRYLAGFMRSAGIGHAGLSAGAASGPDTALPNRHGMTTRSNYELSAAVYWQLGDYFLLSGGVQAYEGDSTPTGSVLSVGREYAQLDVGYRDHWLSPFTDSAMLLGTQAVTMPSITLSNYQPLTRWNLRYELFMAEMEETDSILFQGALVSGQPRLAGVHLSIEPLPGWSLGVSRILQHGGGGRPDRAGDLFDALFNPSDYDNTGTEEDFGNQVASFVSRFVLADPIPLAVYFEYAGEDTSTLSNLRLGNSSLSIGVDLPTLWDNFGLTVELSEWQNGWYVHHIYQGGLVNDGHVIGHWGADRRNFNDGFGARSLMTRVDWRPKFGGAFEASYRQLDNEDYFGDDYDRATQLDVRYSYPWQQFFVGGELIVGRDTAGESYSRLSAFVRF
jgi:hypothetical protein